MVIDTSAIIAILNQESDAESLSLAIEADPLRLVSAATVVEAGMVALSQRGERGAAWLDAFLDEMGVEVVPLSRDHARLACEAFRQYGKGRHPARLNFGDCCSYALAKASGHALLFKGEDFTKTDVTPVLHRRR